MLTSVMRGSRAAVTRDEIASGRDARTRVPLIPRRLPLLAIALVLHAVWLEGCVSYKPRALEEVPFRERAETLERNGVRVTAAALGRSEARDLFGVPLEMDDLFVERGIGNRVVVPGDHKKGFVFTHLDEGTKHVTVGLLSVDGKNNFDLFVQVPGLRVDHERFDEAKLYPSQDTAAPN